LEALRAKLIPVLASIADDKFRYEPLIYKERYIYKQKGECWCMLEPHPVDPKMLFLDGGYSVNVDVETMTFSNLREIAW
jgi:hypothetical protein